MPVLWELLQIPFSFSLIQPFSFSITYGFQHELIWVEWTSLYLPRKGRKSNGHLSLKSEQKPINSHKVVQYNETTNPKGFSKKMYNFLKIWHIKETKKNFFPSVYMKMSWTCNYLKVIRIQPIFWKKERKRKKKKKERKKERKQKYFLSVYFFSICIYENELGKSPNLLTLF